MKFRMSFIVAPGCLVFCQTGCGVAANQLNRGANILTAPVRAVTLEEGADISGDESQTRG